MQPPNTWTPPLQEEPPGPNRAPVYVALVAAVVVVAITIGGAMWLTRKPESAPAATVTATSTPAGLATCRFCAALSDTPSLPHLKRLVGLAGASGVPELEKIAADHSGPTYREAWDAQTAIAAWCSAHYIDG